MLKGGRNFYLFTVFYWLIGTVVIRYPLYFTQVGWWKLLPKLGGDKVMDPLVYKQTYWKMTNLTDSWSGRYVELPGVPTSYRLLHSHKLSSYLLQL